MLVQKEIESCKTAFAKIDIEGKGYIDVSDLRILYREMGVRNLNEDDLFNMVRRADLDKNGVLSFEEFIKIVEIHGAPEDRREESDGDTLLAFMSLGGGQHDGKVDISKLKKIIKDFDLSIDVDTLVKDLHCRESGFVDFVEFKLMLQTSPMKSPQKAAYSFPEHSLIAALQGGRSTLFLPDAPQSP